MKRGWYKLSALCLALWLLLGTLPAPLRAEGEADVVIQTTAEFLDFASRCSLDAWSRGKTVRLDADIDLSGAEFYGVPSFGGVFLGNGHRITGYAAAQGGSAAGLFRYIQAGGELRELEAGASLDAGSGSRNVGGIAGVNAGKIEDCVFRGVVRGESAVGGVAGLNEDGGVIEGCAVSGAVQGVSATGGVAGRNRGALKGCRSAAAVNTDLRESGSLMSSLTETDLLTQLLTGDASREADRVLSTNSDTGGIAGLSTGSIEDCVNTGEIGYPHVGYNMGGVVGRQSGYLSGCVNRGAVHGRKDVGGVAGQAEPDVTVNSGYDAMSRLYSELTNLTGLLNRGLDDTDQGRSELTELLRSIGRSADLARDSVKGLMDESADIVDENVEAANDLGDRVDEALGYASEAMDDASASADLAETETARISAAVSRVSAGLEEPEVERLKQDADDLQAAADSARQSADALSRSMEEMRSAAEERDLEAVRAAGGAILSAAGELAGRAGDAMDALSDMKTQIDALEQKHPDLDKQAAAELRGATDTAEELWRSLRSAGEELSKAGEALQKGGGVSLSPVSDAARESSSALYGALSEMSEQMSALEGVLNSTGDALSEDLRAINSQMNSIFRIATDAVTDAQSVSADDAELVEDASDVNVEGIRAGKLELCRNDGAVDGDRNVGGVVGSMAIEYELDPENDLTGSLRFGSVFETRAVALRCVNSGAVTAKKDCAGGVAGEMDLGSVIECENYGDVESTDGSYAGGIAGLSRGMLRSCWSKCRVSALSYLGGVAGDAEKLMGCRAIADIDGAGKPYAGAIAGFADPAGGQVRENLFLDLGEAGIDGVSYAGIAESAEFEALCGWEAVPDAFTRFHLTLSADGKLVSRIPFRYGRDLRRVSLPQIPRKEGFYAAWPDFDRSGRVSDLYVEAVYTPWITLLPSPQREGERALVLAEGEFTAAAVLDAAAEAMAPPEGTKEGRPLRLSLQGAGNPGALPLRFLNTAGKNAALWQYADGQWRKLDSVLNGGYLMALAPAEGVYCVCVPDGAPLWLIPCAAGAALLAFCAALLGRRRSKQRKQAQNHAKEAENAENTENTETQKS